MDEELLGILSAYSVAVPLLIGCARLKNLSTTFIPFLLLIIFGFINEVISQVANYYSYNANLNNNIFILLQACLIAWQFKRFRLFEAHRKVFDALIIFYLVFWLSENIFLHFSTAVCSYFLIVSSLFTALMCITMINKLVIKEQGLLLINPYFLICICLLFFFTFQILTEAFFLYGLSESLLFAKRINILFLYVNLITNLAFGFACLWIPTKPKFILPS